MAAIVARRTEGAEQGAEQGGTLRSQLVAELGPLREHLAEHPEDEERLRADVRARGLTDRFPWRRLNRGRARDLAVLYCFTPYLDTSALVAARRLHVRGVVTDVVSQQLDGLRRVDESSERVAREYLDETRVLPGEPRVAEWPATRTFVEGVLAEVADLEAAKGPYRTLYTRAMAPQSHFAGAVLKLRNPDLHWTAEFSDPILVNAYGEHRDGDIEDDWLTEELTAGLLARGFEAPATRRLFAWAELVAYALADEIMFTNAHQQRFMLAYCEDRRLAERAASIGYARHQPTLPAEFYRMKETTYPLDPDVVNIGYFGLFFRTRGLQEIVTALASLSPEERRRVHLHVFTDNPRPLQEEMAATGMDDVISVRAYVPFLRFLNLTTRFDVLLVNDAVTSHFEINPYLPSKVSDYRGSGTPIWAAVEPGSVLSSMEVDHLSELGDVDGALAVLRDLLASRGLP